jgi:alpha-L-rhamnosidase
MAGFVELELDAKGGEVITLTHGEVLDAEGNFQIRNMQNAQQPYCTQRVEYTCAPGMNRWHQTKAYYGFRYALVETELPITGGEFTAVAVYSDMAQTAFFQCGHEGVDRLFQNCLWSMRSNFVDIPTDCPHREKAGFTGDLQVFSGAALYLMDCYPVLARYLTECAAGQREDGCVRQIVPYWTAKGSINGAAGWSDAFEIVLHRLMKGFRSTALARQLYPELRKWMHYCVDRARPSRPENEHLPREVREWLVDTANHWGEWCEPGWSASDYFAERDATGHAEFATAFLSHGCALMADIAQRLGEQEDAAYFKEASRKARAAYRHVYLQDGSVHSERQCHYVRPLAFGLLETEEVQPVVDDLVQKIRSGGNTIGTGFLTTCYLCDVLTDLGYSNVAYDLLLNTKQPGWLFEVEQGATTIWESWYGIRSDGSRRGSHNHYAFGAVSGWLMSRVAGIRVEDGAVMIRPYPDRRLGFVQAQYDSPLGTIGSSWRYEGDKLSVEVQIPPNANTELILPDGSKHTLTAGKHSFLISA